MLNLTALLLLLCVYFGVPMMCLAEELPARKPTLWLIGDSTVRVGTPGQQGWGDPLSQYFDLERIDVVNKAIGGRSSRTFLMEGRWYEILQEAQPGDFVIMQFGHNDAGNINDDHRARGTIRNNSDDTVLIDNILTGRRELVHSYGWYLRKYIRDARAYGLTRSSAPTSRELRKSRCSYRWARPSRTTHWPKQPRHRKMRASSTCTTASSPPTPNSIRP